MEASRSSGEARILRRNCMVGGRPSVAIGSWTQDTEALRYSFFNCPNKPRSFTPKFTAAHTDSIYAPCPPPPPSGLLEMPRHNQQDSIVSNACNPLALLVEKSGNVRVCRCGRSR